MKKPHSYRDAGVDIERGDRFARFIAAIDSPAIAESLGGFAGGLPLDLSGYREPLLMSSTDGVGTKLLVAAELGVYDTVGIDLVAMCVNDLLVCGAEPLLFLDYIACGALDESILEPVLRGIVRGCEISGCVLAGGETAELPDMYGPRDIDLAGFAVGIVERSRQLPQRELIRAGDPVLGIASSGLHSNGYSLARRVLPKSCWAEALTPTRIYAREMGVLRSLSGVRGAAHITGGGLAGNIARVLPDQTTVELNWSWSVPSIFTEIAAHVTIEEMRRVFNMGIGLAVIVAADAVERVLGAASEHDIALSRIGTVTDG
ncbi:MAG: phosphoribosylformylglycinamidine cyclo-ligase [Spirochaetaceae bacterium]|nr:MAG: phosphoribosylformylglycinamidine cyclo-ligase [Spirochaetaceae bacterium]